MNKDQKEKKRGDVSGFDGVQGVVTQRRIQNWTKNQPAGRWRKIKPFSIRYTYIKQTWYYFEKSFTRVHISPYGMKEYVKDLLAKDRNVNKKALPIEVKKAFDLSDDDFDKADLNVICEDEGDKGFSKFIVLYCEKCVKVSHYKCTLLHFFYISIFSYCHIPMKGLRKISFHFSKQCQLS